jgi:Transglycosylase SLT domain
LRLKRLALSAFFMVVVSPAVRGEYIVLRSGQRIAVTGYQLLDNYSYRLQMKGGTVDVPVEQVLTIEPEEVFTPVPQVEVSKEPFGDLIRAAAKRYSVDADLITSVIAAESNFDPKAISRRDARGLMQLLPTTAAHLGVRNIFDPQENIDAGTHYLSELLFLYKNDVALTLAAYNAGPERVQRFGQRVPPFAETISYVRRVKQTYNQRKSGIPTEKSKLLGTPIPASPKTAPSAASF